MKWVPLETYLLTADGRRSLRPPGAVAVSEFLPTQTKEEREQIRWTDPFFPIVLTPKVVDAFSDESEEMGMVQEDLEDEELQPEELGVVQEDLKFDELQLVAYALETLSALGNRRFVLGLHFDGCQGHIWYFSRSVIISSTSFHIEAQFTTFASIIATLPRLSLEGLGFDPNIFSLAPPICPPRSLDDWILRLPKEDGGACSYASILRIIYIEKCIIGRGTTVGLIGSFIEHDLETEHGRRLYQETLSQKRPPAARTPVTMKSLVTFEDDAEEKCYNLLRAREKKYEGRWVFKLSSQTLTRPSELGFLKYISSAGIRRIPDFKSDLSEVLSHLSDGPLDALRLTDSSGLRVLVSEYIHDVCNLWGVELKKALHDSLYIIQDLHNNAKVLHRDISINNLAYRRCADGRVEGIVYDFGLAMRLDMDAAPPKHAVGTPAFMAIHLLDDRTLWHRLSFEYESRDPLRNWYIGTTASISATKWTDLQRPLRILPHHNSFRGGLQRLRNLVLNALFRMTQAGMEIDLQEAEEDEEEADSEAEADDCRKKLARAPRWTSLINYERLSSRGITAESLGLTADGFSTALKWRDVLERYERGEVEATG
ncbi:hypothetical protein BOTBODRAFT_69746 [Botryobasidium botryosum FD-172 SS1]|uniref:Protein kinase domain-containing protein n=1 Tax=Botryobasidium botryosum (strain FD-172 SS1) TaxID=930990 RepID=A0A067MA26_BOTB1|nr:hypothetical protein BOTBODRAFT_69746 [Botryobasidium botryosum FD-172 SS1]